MKPRSNLQLPRIYIKWKINKNNNVCLLWFSKDGYLFARSQISLLLLQFCTNPTVMIGAELEMWATMFVLFFSISFNDGRKQQCYVSIRSRSNVKRYALVRAPYCTANLIVLRKKTDEVFKKACIHDSFRAGLIRYICMVDLVQ